MTITDVRRTVLDAARALAPELSLRALQGETQRTMPVDLVRKARDAGLFRLALPRALGGLEIEPLAFVDVIEELARADGSAGWTVLIGNSTSFFAWLDPQVARDMIGDDVGCASTSMFGPLGSAVADGSGGFTVDGRWPFNSGCAHSAWFQAGVFLSDGHGPRMLPDRGPDWRLAFFRPEDARILDTWDAVGLRGTGSHDLTVSGLRVPEEHLASPFFDPPRHDGPLWRIPFFTQLAIYMVGFPLGVARRALDEFTTLAVAKRRGGTGDTLADTGDVQVALARAEAGVRSARAFAHEVIGDVWDTALAGDAPTMEQRGLVQLAAQQARLAGTAAVDAVFSLAGASAVYSSDPLQRCFRDLHTAGQHIFFSPESWKRFARMSFGIDQPMFMV